MEIDKKKQSEAVALFRYGLIADLTHLAPGTRGLYRLLEEKAAKDYCIPSSTRTRVAEETLRGWLKQWRVGGFEALQPRPRSDLGGSRALPQEVKDLLLSIKEDNRELSVQLIIKEALATRKVPEEVSLAPTTVHRLFARAGLMRRDARPDGAGGRAAAEEDVLDRLSRRRDASGAARGLRALGEHRRVLAGAQAGDHEERGPKALIGR